MKKLMLLTLAIMLTLSLAACKESGNPSNDPNPPISSDSDLAATDDIIPASPEVEEEAPVEAGTAIEEEAPVEEEVDESIYTYPVAVGDIIEFGEYEWRVLDLKGGKVLVLSEYIVEQRQYHSVAKGILWETCDLRQYLNEDFYNSFTEDEQAQIAETLVVTGRNPWFGSSGGADTTDKIFILSLDEVAKYFGDSGKLYAPPGSQYMVDDEYNSARKAYDKDGTALTWWLRSAGPYYWDATAVSSGGLIDPSGLTAITDESTGVRPAMWLNLEI